MKATQLHSMTPLEIIQSFADFFEVERIFSEYNEWLDEKEALEKKVSILQHRLDVGGLDKEIRKGKVKERDLLIKRKEDGDPRLVQATRFDSWLQSLGVEEDNLDKARGYAAKGISDAMKDHDSIKENGLPPLQYLRTGSGRSGYHKLMDLKDYAIQATLSRGQKDKNQTKRQSRDFERMMIQVKNHYSELPIELEEAAERVRLTIDFKQRLAGILEDMVSDRIKQVGDNASVVKIDHDVNLTEPAVPYSAEASPSTN